MDTQSPRSRDLQMEERIKEKYVIEALAKIMARNFKALTTADGEEIKAILDREKNEFPKIEELISTETTRSAKPNS